MGGEARLWAAGEMRVGWLAGDRPGCCWWVGEVKGWAGLDAGVARACGTGRGGGDGLGEESGAALGRGGAALGRGVAALGAGALGSAALGAEIAGAAVV